MCGEAGQSTEPKEAVAMAGNQLHNFVGDAAERRQYRRMNIQFPLWWLKGGETGTPVAGIGVEISGGGIQFLLQEQLPLSASQIAFEIEGRRMRANIVTILAAGVEYKEQPWQHHRAKFIGLRETDFDFIVALTARDLEKRTTGPGGKERSLQSYDTLPAKIKADMVDALVSMKRLTRPRDPKLLALVAHYGGLQTAEAGSVAFHRYSIRTKTTHPVRGAMVYDTHFLLSADGTKLIIGE